MEEEEEGHDFTVLLGATLEALSSGSDVQRIPIFAIPGKAIKIGRNSKSDLLITSAGVSWLHAELHLVTPAEGEEANTKPQLVVKDVSSNGTGLKIPGANLERLPKGEQTPVPDGSILALPIRVKAAEDQKFFTILRGGEDVATISGAPGVAAQSAVSGDEPGVQDSGDGSARPISAKRSLPAAPVSNGVVEDSRVGDMDAKRDSDDQATKRQKKSLPVPEQSRPAAALDASVPAVVPEDSMPPREPPREEYQSGPPPSGPPGVRPPPRGARAKARNGPRAAALTDIPLELRKQIETGEDIIREAKEAESRNQWGQAFDCYQRGLKPLMEVLPKLAKDSGGGIGLRNQINGYLTKAAELKEKLDKTQALGSRKVMRPRGPGN